MAGPGELVDARLAGAFADADAVANVKEFGASGSALTTVGDMAAGSRDLWVPNPLDFVPGQGISIANAGPASALLVSTVETIGAKTTAGHRVTLRDAAGTAASAKAVKHDDTTAIQLAINASGPAGTVLLPAGQYPVTSGLTLGKSTQIFGVGTSVASVGTILDASTMASGILLSTPGNSTGAVIANLALVGPALQTTTSRGVYLAGGTQWARVDRVAVTGFQHGIFLDNVTSSQLLQCQTNGCTTAGAYIHAGTFISVIDGCYMNVAGWASHNGNILIDGGAYDVRIALPMVDEAFNQGGGRFSAAIYLQACSNVSIQVPKVYYTHGANSYGIRLGDGTNNPANTQIMVNKVERFSASSAPAAGIEIRGSGHKLYGVTVDVSADSGATGISDLATDTKMYGCVDITSGGTKYIALKDPNLPTASPGAGSKQFWYDAADANRVKFAP